MEKRKNKLSTSKKTLIILLVIGVAYFLIMLPPNATGAKDANMLGVFNNDEFAQYPFVIHMITPGPTLYQSIRNFAVYSYYYYGYPFFFFSALFLLPVKWILGSGWTNHTQTIMTYLRQIINVLPMLIAIGFMVYIQTQFKSFWRSITLFLILLLLPAVTSNSLWWHPDSLLTLFCILTIFFLWRDNFQLGKNLIYAAIFCGLSIGTKQPGFLFFLTIPSYIIWSGIKKKITIWKILSKMVIFLIIMSAIGILSNPLLLLPIERGEIIQLITKGMRENVVGFYSNQSGELIKWASTAFIVTESNGRVFFILLGMALLLIGIFQPKKRLISVLILSWFIPFTLYLVFVETVMKSYYFLPVVIPFFSNLDIVLEKIPTLFTKKWELKNLKSFFENVLISIAIILLILQIVIFSITNVKLYQSTVSREENSASIIFYRAFQSAIITKLPSSLSLKIYHDWKAYVPDGVLNWQYYSTFSLASYEYIDQIRPDVILLESENENFFSNPNLLINPVNKEQATKRYDFYSDAVNGKILGYQLVYKDSFGSAFLISNLAENYIR
jgi:hypothetical protein